MLEHLFTPVNIGSLKLANRIIFGPHATGYETNVAEESPGRRYADYLVRRVQGGAGLVFGGYPGVNYSLGVGKIEFTIGFGTFQWKPHQKGTQAESSFKRYFSDLAKAVHAVGGRIFAQLSMGAGNQTYGYPHIVRPDYLVLSASQTSNPASGMMARELDLGELRMMARAAAEVARAIKHSEFDGIEFHSHAGYLMSNFLSPGSNRRTDCYGGCLENRTRFLFECLRQIRSEVGPSFPLGVRYSAYEDYEGGLTLDDGVEIGRKLDESKLVDEISMTGAPATGGLGIPNMSYAPGFLRPVSAKVKSVMQHGTPVVCVGRINDPELAEQIIAKGDADMVALVRPLIADPDLPKKAREGRFGLIRRCTSSNEGCIAMSMGTWVREVRCTVNPETGREREYATVAPIDRVKKVLIIGAGPAGLKAAEQAAARRHHVVLLEKEKELGGQVTLQAKVASRKLESVLVDDLAAQLRRLGVDMRLGIEATMESALAENPDVIVLANGSYAVRSEYTTLRPDLPHLPGAEQSFVLTDIDVLRGAIVGQKVVVVEDNSGGDNRAPLVVEYLLDCGHEVTALTTADRLGHQLTVFDHPPMLKRMYCKGMKVRPHTGVTRIEDKAIIAYNVYSHVEERIEGVNTVVLIVGRRTDRSLFQALSGKVAELYEIGDAVSPRTVNAAILEGFLVGRSV